jgi:hypothetical protein
MTGQFSAVAHDVWEGSRLSPESGEAVDAAAPTTADPAANNVPHPIRRGRLRADAASRK